MTAKPTAEQVLDRIADIMSGEEWNADTLDEIAEAVRATGRTIADVDFVGGDDGLISTDFILDDEDDDSPDICPHCANPITDDHRPMAVTYEHCGITWTSEWCCACDDECPVCGKAIEASTWEVIEKDDDLD